MLLLCKYLSCQLSSRKLRLWLWLNEHWITFSVQRKFSIHKICFTFLGCSACLCVQYWRVRLHTFSALIFCIFCCWNFATCGLHCGLTGNDFHATSALQISTWKFIFEQISDDKSNIYVQHIFIHAKRLHSAVKPQDFLNTKLIFIRWCIALQQQKLSTS